MRILSCCRSYPTIHAGGMEMVCMVRAEELARQGHEVHVATAGDKAEVGEKAGVAVHYMAGRRGGYSEPYAAGCHALAASLCPDILHLDSWDDTRLWWTDRPGNPKRIAMTYHGGGWGRQLGDWAQYRNAGGNGGCSIDGAGVMSQVRGVKAVDVVIAISPFEQWQIQDLYATRAELVYNPIQPHFFATPPVPVPQNAPWVANAERWPELAQQATVLAGKRLRLLKGIAPADMPKAYDESAGLLVPTFLVQGFDLMVGEALSRRRPVIVFATGSYYWACHNFDGVRGVVPGDVAAMANLMNAEWPDEPVPASEQNIFRPDVHAKSWLGAIA